MTTTSPATSVLDEVGTWPGVSTQPTPRGSTAIVFEGHELGHVHADRGTLDLPLSTTDVRRWWPRRVRSSGSKTG
jgi:Luciferase